MTDPPPVRLRDDCCHEFHLDSTGAPRPGRLNMTLLP